MGAAGVRPPLLPLAIVVATSRNRCIGRDGGLPWHLPEDLRHFRAVTTGHAIIMGRRTHESIGRPLPKRRNIVLSRNPAATFEGCDTAASLEDAVDLARAGGDDEPRVIGGASVYAAALPVTTRIFLTEVDRTVEGDTFFPPLEAGAFVEISRRRAEGTDASFVELERSR
jgi:dihydrofolate reductase